MTNVLITGAGGFLGLLFEAEDGMHFGFVELSVDEVEDENGPLDTLPSASATGDGGSPTPLAIRISRVGFDTEPLSAIPEPVGLGVLAMGAAGLAALRRRR